MRRTGRRNEGRKETWKGNKRKKRMKKRKGEMEEIDGYMKTGERERRSRRKIIKDGVQDWR